MGHRSASGGSACAAGPPRSLISAAIVFVVPYGVADLLGSADFKPLSSLRRGLAERRDRPRSSSIAFVTLLALTEEIGWRGYLLPRVQTMVSKRRAALVVGFIHGMFHVPLMVFTTTYNSIGSRWIVVPTVVVTLTAAGVFYAWLKDRSGSVWPVAVAHGTVNVLIDGTAYAVVLARSPSRTRRPRAASSPWARPSSWRPSSWCGDAPGAEPGRGTTNGPAVRRATVGASGWATRSPAPSG